MLIIDMEEDSLPQGEKRALAQAKKRMEQVPFDLAVCEKPEHVTAFQSEAIPAAGYEGSGRRHSCRYVLESFEGLSVDFANLVHHRFFGLPFQILATRRCIVREFAMSDLDALVRLYSGEGITDYVAPLFPYEEEKEYERKYIQNVYDIYGVGMWLVIEKGSGKLIGRCGVEVREGGWELGYVIASDYQRRGFATEVTTAILDYAKARGGKDFYCRINPKNAPSVALARKLGFAPTGERVKDEVVWRLGTAGK